MTKTVERDVRVIPLKERQVNSAPSKNLLYKLFPRERNRRRNRAHVVYGFVGLYFLKMTSSRHLILKFSNATFNFREIVHPNFS